ncbi:alcohol dehydrogenase [Pseudovirgaria hyperparasitica]|uniref:Alcohol dehydrogenase n=1 Tax=Pseudovirgaria hyperparasitica TaxID=470096 RepID=A0A6A6WDN1_9PEZI|nr:alcohol dehydrogenase [Pseudovirgaria hyperparasitica]KAF2760675.1 alcohol dehydrogenase [Pseudovirgaria hyperparasitica]
MPTALSIRRVEGKPGEVYYPLEKVALPEPNPSDSEVVVQLTAAALNHRDLFIRQHLYPAISFGTPLLADGCGVVVKAGPSPEAQGWLHKRVIINPGTGWKDDPDGPESQKGYAILGGTKLNNKGTLAECITIDASELEEVPSHLSDVEAAALPLAGLTAWRAFASKSGNAEAGRNILVTGIGGGVALMVLMFASAAGCNVYVSSGDEAKLTKAKDIGAQGGVNYREDGWEKKLVAQLPQPRKYLDAIIDGAGGNIVEKGMRLLKPGGIISMYGMTTGPKMPWVMGAVMRNIELRGSTMGSRKEFGDMVAFVNKKKLHPIVSRTVQGLDNLDGINTLFEDMKNGTQFGKLVVEISTLEIDSKL